MALNVAIAGYGLAGSVFHAPLVEATEGLELRAVVTRDPRRREHLAREHPGVRAADAVEDVVEDVDLVVVASPNRWHAPIARTALDAGCHVVVDKPLAVSAADARELAERARAAGRLVMPFHNRRWDDDFLTLRALVEQERLGRVLRLESRFDRWRPVVRGELWREGGDPEEGGGLLLDLGSHLADQAVQLLGPPVAVYAELDRRRPGAEVEDDVFIALTHEGGARSHLWAGVVAAHLAPRFRVLGDRAAFTSEGLDPQEAQLRAGLRPGDEGFGRRPREGWGALHDGERAEPVPMRAGAWPAFYEGVAAAIAGGAPPPATAEQGAAVIALLEAARRSAETREVVAL
jgi:scyllo-inositol 2-dehydrogenase (NADP+)